MEAGFTVGIHTPEGPPIETIPPDRLALGEIYAAMHKKNSVVGFIVCKCDMTTTWHLLIVPKDFIVSVADHDHSDLPELGALRKGPITVGEA